MNKCKLVSLIHGLPRVLAAVAVITVGLADLALAQDWRFEPIIRVGGEFDDNATLSIFTVDEVELEGYLLDLKADINYFSPKSSFFIQPRFLLRNYPDESDFDSDDIFVRSNYRYNGTSSDFGFRANFDRESVRTAERTDSDLGIEDPAEIPDNDTGRLLRFGTRDLWRIAPFWDYTLSTKSRIGVDASYVDAQYDDQIAALLVDYSDIRLNFNYRYSLTNVTTGLFKATGRRYETDAADSQIDGVGVLAGVEHLLSEKTRITAMIGLEDTDSTGPNTDPEIVGFATIIRNLETIRMFAQYQRTISASGAGRLSVRDAVNLNFRRRLNEKVTAGLGVRAYQSRGIGDVASIDDRNYIQLQSSFVWYLTDYFAIEADYRYTVLDRSDVLGERSNSNRINLWFVYQPNTVPDI
jgi:hypothetical protein